MDSQLYLKYEFTGTDTRYSGCSLSPLNFAPSNILISSQFDCDTWSVTSNSRDHHGSIDTIPCPSASPSSQLESDSLYQMSHIQLLESVQEESNSSYAITRQNMRHALQEIETILMAPEIDDLTPMSTKANFSERKQHYLTEEMLSEWSNESLSSEVRPAKRLKETREEPDCNVKHLLIRCAEAVSENNIKEFKLLFKQAQGLVSISGDPIQRLGAYMLEGLMARQESSGTKIYRSLRCREPKSNELLSYMRILYEVCPYMKFGYMAANAAIAEAMRNEDKIHIIDFQIAQGTQWVTLIQALASRPGGPPHVRITGIDDPVSEYARGDSLHLVGKTLSEMSKKFNIVLEFHPLNVYGPSVTREMLDIRPGEALAVNFAFQLHHTPDESIDVNNPRDGLIRLAKGLNPKVTTLVEQESNTNTTPFLARFIETFDFYSAMFESIDSTLPRDRTDRISVEQHCLAKDIVNMIACEGKERVERHELLGKWQSRFRMAGFKPCPLSLHMNSVIRTLMGNYSDKYSLVEKDGALLLGWKNRSLISASAWQ